MKKIILSSLFFVVLALQSSCLFGQTFITVDNIDTNPLTPNSLANAIAQLNALPSPPNTDVNIHFDPSLAGQTIPVPTVLDISYTGGAIIFNSTEVDITLDGIGNLDHLLKINDVGVNLTIKKTKFIRSTNKGALFINFAGSLTSLSVTLDNCQFLDNQTTALAGTGGAILVQNAGAGGIPSPSVTLQIQNCLFNNNKAPNGTGSGGAIYSEATNNSRTYITITNSKFSSNEAISDGGAMAIKGASHSIVVTNTLFESNKGTGIGGIGGVISTASGGLGAGAISFSKCTFKNNEANQDGGAMYLNASNFLVTLNDCKAYGNKALAKKGGFAYHSDGTLTLNRCAIYKNTATNDAGGGIYSTNTLTLFNTSFIENTASTGGGIQATGSLSVTNCTIVKNEATSGNGGGIWYNASNLTLNNSLVANNLAPTSKDIHQDGVGAPSGGNNFITELNGSGFGVGTQTLDNNHVIALADATGTYAYKPNPKASPVSPLIGTGNNTNANLGANPIDQLGNTRKVGSLVDIGAVEAPLVLIVKNTDGNVITPLFESLPWAIKEVNTVGSQTDPTEILFAIPNAPFRIEPNATLTLDRPAIIDGFSQAGTAKNPDLVGYNATLLIEVDGKSIPAGGSIFTFTTAACVLQGVVLNNSTNTTTPTGVTITNQFCTVRGCIIGLNAAGSAATTGKLNTGIVVNNWYNQIGGTNLEDRNIIANCGTGVAVIGSQYNYIQNNYIGTDRTGSNMFAVTTGITIDPNAVNNRIGGSTASNLGNVIGATAAGGIAVEVQGNGNLIQGNYIGIKADGTGSLATLPSLATGIRLTGNGNLIGGYTDNERNVIGGHNMGIDVQTSKGANKLNDILRNYIGTNPAGNGSISNGRGIVIAGNSGTVTVANNVVSGNTNYGIGVSGNGVENITIKNNVIGFNASKTSPLLNQGDGINILGVNNSLDNKVLIGDFAEGNTIGNNGGAGIRVDNSLFITVRSNTISNNTQNGVTVQNGSNNTTLQGNTLSNNTQNGVYIGISNNTTLSNNTISNNTQNGLDLTSAHDALLFNNTFSSNAQNGVFMENGTSGTRMQQNTLSSNTQNGIALAASAGINNNFAYNSFFSNGDLGIDLKSDGVTGNDINLTTPSATDGDIGANNLLNFPEISSIVQESSTGNWIVTFRLPVSSSNASYPLDAIFYKTIGGRQGNTFVSTTTVPASNANMFVSVSIPAIKFNYGDQIVALTYERSSPTSSIGNTSEFSSVYTLIQPCPAKPTITAIQINQKVTCTLAEATAIITLGANSLGGLYEVDLQGDGVYDLTGLTLTNNQLRFPASHGMVFRNPVVRNIQLPNCPSAAYSFAQTMQLLPLQVATIQSVSITDPTNCDSSNGSVSLNLSGSISNIGYDVDLDGNGVYEFTSVRTNSANQLIINNLQGGTKIGSLIQIREAFSADCRSNFQMQSRSLAFTSVTRNIHEVKINSASLDFESETTVEVSNTEQGLTYALAFQTVFSTAYQYVSDFATASNGKAILSTGKLYKSSSLMVIAKNANGCTQVVPNSNVAVQVADGIFSAQIDILRLIYNSAGGDNWKRKWIFNKPQSFAGVTFLNGDVLAIDLSDQNLKDTIPASPFRLLQKLQQLSLANNKLTFGTLENFEQRSFQMSYDKQEKIGKELRFTTVETATLTLEVKTAGQKLTYQWFRNGQPIVGAENAVLKIVGIKTTEQGAYTCQVKSTLMPAATLETEKMFVTVLPLPKPADLTKLRAFYENLGGNNWKEKWNFNDPNLANWFGVKTNNENKVIEISLTGNNLVGELPAEVFTGENNIFSELTHLNLSNNQLSQIPDNLDLLRKLTYLDLSYNALQGRVPKVIFNLQNLQTLNLGRNQFDELGGGIGNLTKLQTLFLDHNLFPKLPNEMANLTELEIFFVQNNLLKAIDWNIGVHQKMKYMWFSNNQLRQIPPQITSLKNLEEFSVASNLLTDLPDLNQLPKLNMLNISSNQLDFGDLETLLKGKSGGRVESIARFFYVPQAHFGEVQNLSLPQGNTLNLVAQTAGTGNLYKWFRNGVEIKNNVSPQRNALQINDIAKDAGGVYTVEVTNPIAPELTLHSKQFNVTVTCALQTSILISLRGTPNVCENENTDRLLVVNNLTTEKVQWFRDNARIVGETNYTLNTKEVGKYKALITDPTGCSNFTNEIEIKRFSAPQVLLEADFALLKVRNPSQFATFQWFKDNQAIPNATGATWQAVELGNYQVRVVDRNGCVGLSNFYAITPTASNSETLDNQEFIAVYPNPARNELHIFVPHTQRQNYEIELWNAQGQKIQHLEKQGFTNATTHLSLENLPSGLYLLKLRVGEQILTKKVLVEK